MNNELSTMFKKLGLSFFVALIFVIPASYFVYNNFDNGNSKLFDKMKKSHALIFITSNNCNECKSIEKELKDNNIDYYKINKDTHYKNYKIVLSKVKLNEDYAPSPSLILVEKNNLSVNINEFDEVDLEDFFEEYNLK